MKLHISPSLLRYAIIVLFILAAVKLLWFVAETVWFPVKSIDHIEGEKAKPLYYRVKLTPNESTEPMVKEKPISKAGRIEDIKLLGVYHALDNTVITVSYKKKTKVLAKDESINGFTLKSAGSRYAIFSKNGKQYRITIEEGKQSSDSYRELSNAPTTPEQEETDGMGEVVDAGDHKIVDRDLIKHYTKNMNDIYKDIGIQEIKKDNTIDGFRITFLKRGTPFAKLGLRRGDILKTINGQALNSYNAAFEAYQNINTVTNITLVIQRGDKEMEIEYEIN